MPHKHIDYIIIGQGIAGSVLAYKLLKAGNSIMLFDEFNPNSSSNIAAGVINPITGRKMVKSWLIDEVLPIAKSTYIELEELLNTTFFFEKDIYKIFSDQEDVSIWNNKKTDTEYINYLGDILPLSEKNSAIAAPYSAGVIKNACWLDVPAFTKAFRDYLKEKKMLIEAKFDIAFLKISDVIQYKNVYSKGIIFCEGYQAHINPLFSWIPFALAKGEQLLICDERLQLNEILNKNIFIIPRGHHRYNIGSTFIWNDLDETVTDQGRAEILAKLNKIIKTPYTIIEEKAGIRPAMTDRRPVIGPHPDYSNVFIFNGLGTKGVSLTPFLASHFVGFLNAKNQIFKEISINRFVK